MPKFEQPNGLEGIVERLGMDPHPEGGYYLETYRSTEQIDERALPGRFMGARAFSTATYVFLPQGTPFMLHKLPSDEMWHFYGGSPLTIVEMHAATGVKVTALGSDLLNGQSPQYVVSAGTWFGAIADEGDALVGCTMSPGFDLTDYQTADREYMMQYMSAHPAAPRFIKQLTSSSCDEYSSTSGSPTTSALDMTFQYGPPRAFMRA
eukprot:Clim_evm32s229 gene=Clim_evmTU32s229